MRKTALSLVIALVTSGATLLTSCGDSHEKEVKDFALDFAKKLLPTKSTR